jgi:two-component system, NtrC family, sensor histidine kinase HydH
MRLTTVRLFEIGKDIGKRVIFLLREVVVGSLRLRVQSTHEKLRVDIYCVTGACKIADVGSPIETGLRGPRWFLRFEDFVWLTLFSALAIFNTEKNYPAIIILSVLAVFQVLEPRVKVFSSPRGLVLASAVKLLLAWLLVGFTDPISGFYYDILFVPVISAATTLGLGGTFAFILLACASYLSFLRYVDWSRVPLTPEDINVLILRCLFLFVVGFLVYQQAHGKREEMRRTEEAATRLRTAEASLRRSERLAALGQLTAGLAHELRNPLGTIKASADMMTKSASNPDVLAEMAGYISSEVDRTNALISRFLDFAKPLELHAALADLSGLLDDVIAQAQPLAGKRDVQIEKHMGPGDFTFVFDRELLQLALLNLIQNAVQASKPGQRVRVEAETEGSQVTIALTDAGSGIAAEHLESVFNPFFTTKPDGVGLGLALVAKIVDEHQGRILVRSEIGRGTTFEVTLPRQES